MTSSQRRRLEPTELVAGRELDALIAEKVMGWVWAHSPCADEAILISAEAFTAPWQKLDGTEPRYTTYHNVRHYSTDIAAAWEVVNVLIAKGFVVSVDNLLRPWTCYVALEAGCDPLNDGIAESADTAPFAICLAALAGRIGSRNWL